MLGFGTVEMDRCREDKFRTSCTTDTHASLMKEIFTAVKLELFMISIPRSNPSVCGTGVEGSRLRLPKSS